MNRALLDLQLLDSAIQDATREKTRLDDGSAARASLAELEAQLAQTKEAAATVAATRAQAEGDLEAAETKIERQKKRIMTVSSAHEISALERDIEGLSRMRGELDETILIAMDDGETLATKVATQEKQVAQARAAAEKIAADFKAQTELLDKRIAGKKAERAPVIAKFSPNDKERYAEAYKRHHGTAVAHVESGSCSACGAEILPFTLREAKTQEFPTCEGCGRMLWVE